VNLPNKFERNAGLFITLVLLLMQIACDGGRKGTAVYNDLVLTVEANRSQARVGEPVQIRFTITNTGRQTEVVESNDKPVMDIIVQVVGDRPLLVWSEQNPDQVSHHLQWQPGESKIIEWSWTPKQGDVYVGAFRDIFLSGVLYWGPNRSQSASVTLCASNVCR
jgi:hypothetical protein